MRLAALIGAIILVTYLATKPHAEELHKLAFLLGVGDCILVGWSFFFASGGH